MNQFLAYWKKTKFTDKLSRVKHVYIEQRDAVGFSAVLANYTAFMDNFCGRFAPLSRADQCKQRGLQPSSVTGAIFFGVCRGKISEGIDFKDYMARAVISLSIPYPNAHAHEIRLMREYMDQHHQLNPALPDGSAWYDEQAFRALNQGLGRCIRHSRDYGAIILLESRFGNPEVKKRLSRWFRDEIRVSRSDAELIRGLKAFFASCEKEFPAGNGEDVALTQPSVQRGILLTQESAVPMRGRSEEELAAMSTQRLGEGENSMDDAGTGSMRSTVSRTQSEAMAERTQSEEVNGFSSLFSQKSTQRKSVGSVSTPLSAQSQTGSAAIDSFWKPTVALKRSPSDSVQSPSLVAQNAAQSLKRLRSEALFCPVCSQKLADSPWEEIELTLQYGLELVQMARMTMQMHGYNVETGEELGSVKAKLLDADSLIQNQCHTTSSSAQKANREGGSDHQSLYYHPQDRMMFSWWKEVMIRYDVVYCWFNSKVIKNGDSPYRVLVPIGMICKESDKKSSLVGKFVLLPVPSLNSSG